MPNAPLSPDLKSVLEKIDSRNSDTLDESTWQVYSEIWGSEIALSHLRRLAWGYRYLSRAARLRIIIPAHNGRLAFINTHREDALSKFSEVPGARILCKPIAVYSLKYCFEMLLLSLCCLLQLLRGKSLPISIIYSVLVRNYGRLQNQVSFKGSEELLLYSEHDVISIVLARIARERGVKVVVYLHGMPLTAPKGKCWSPSVLLYKRSFASKYVAPSVLQSRRLAWVFRNLNSNFSGDIAVIFPRRCHHGFCNTSSVNPNQKLVVWLSNARWESANERLLSIGSSVGKALSVTVWVRAHPSLSRSWLNRKLGSRHNLCSRQEPLPTDLHIMYHSTVFLDLKARNFRNLFRYSDQYFDDFGVNDGIFSTANELLQLLGSMKCLRTPY